MQYISRPVDLQPKQPMVVFWMYMNINDVSYLW